MRPFSMIFAWLFLLTSCARTGDSDDGAKPAFSHVQGAVSAQRNPPGAHAGPGAGIASLPDRGSLIAYDRVRRIASNGPYTWYPVTLSETHALNGIRTGRLALTAPDGSDVSLSYDRHDEHPDGSWSWIGHDPSGETVLTFGPKAVFGSVMRADGSLMRITTRSNQVYVVSLDAAQLAESEISGRPGKTDFLVPPKTAAAVADRRAGAAAQPTAADAAVDAVATNEIDLLLGYSTGLVASIGSESGAVTRMQNLVAIANQAYQNSNITMRIRLVRSMLVNYPDNTTNDSALEKLTGRTGSGSTPVDPAFNALRAARDESAADLVSLVRQFKAPENEGCGIAWLLGGGQTTIDQSDAPFGYSVVSDGSDVDGASTYFCRDETLAHELGHNMGQAHNFEDREGSSGAHAYSYGYREASASGFYTVMAYRLTDSNQTGIRHFANPSVNWNGRPTGAAALADNARSMNLTMPVIASFRASTPNRWVRSDMNGDGRSDILWRNESAQQFSHWLMNGAVVNSSIGLAMDGNYSVAGTGDFDGDGIGDILWSHKSARFLVIWQGQSGQAYTQLEVGGYPAGTEISGIGDFNADGRSDILWRNRSSGIMFYWAMNGRVSIQSASVAMPAWFDILGTGDFNSDRYADVLYASSSNVNIYYNTGVGFNGAFIAFRPSGWSLIGLGDSNADGIADVYWRNNSSGIMTYWVVGMAGVVSTHTYSPSIAWTRGYIGDYNGDGRADILWDRTEWRQHSMWIASASGGYQGFVVGNYPLNWSVVQ